MLDAAEEIFLRDGYATANMDELAERSGVSKQTIYSHFGSKEKIFVEMATRMTGIASDRVHREVPEPNDTEEMADYLERYALRLLGSVLDPQLVALRRLVIGEATRFPDLARAFWVSGPSRSMQAMSERFTRLTGLGLLETHDPDAAARSFNWLVVAAPLNAAMMLGDAGIPGPTELRQVAAEASRVFLSAYGHRPRRTHGDEHLSARS
jgi:AcrR family transcriptional regulator